MENILTLPKTRQNFKSILLDILALTFIYFVPAISHMFSFPVYLFEPMRIMLILAMAHSGKLNNYIIALTLPLFSVLISTHPSIAKASLMTFELGLNVYLFYFLSKRLKNNFLSILFSIVISKWAYYFLKYVFLQVGLLSGDLVTTPVVYQLITTLVFSLYIYLILGKRGKAA